MTDEEIGDYIRRYVHKVAQEEKDSMLLAMVTMLKGQMSKQARQASEADAYFESAYTAYMGSRPYGYKNTKRDYKTQPNLIEIAEYGDSDGTRNLSNTPVTVVSQYS